MITQDIIAALLASGRSFELTPEGGLIVAAEQQPAKVLSPAARRQEAYRQRVAAGQGVTKRHAGITKRGTGRRKSAVLDGQGSQDAGSAARGAGSEADLDGRHGQDGGATKHNAGVTKHNAGVTKHNAGVTKHNETSAGAAQISSPLPHPSALPPPPHPPPSPAHLPAPTPAPAQACPGVREEAPGEEPAAQADASDAMQPSAKQADAKPHDAKPHDAINAQQPDAKSPVADPQAAKRSTAEKPDAAAVVAKPQDAPAAKMQGTLNLLGVPPADDPQTPGAKAPRKKREPKMASDEAWVQSLAEEEAYKGIDVRVELGRMQVWCALRGKQGTQRRFLNWLNHADRVITMEGVQPQQSRAQRHRPRHEAYQRPQHVTAEDSKF